MMLDVAGDTMKIKPAVKATQQRMNVFHIRLDFKAGWKDEAHEDSRLLMGVLLLVRIAL
jgi:hypothetical protein